jgi:uncharacterized protein (TIGR02391 family)
MISHGALLTMNVEFKGLLHPRILKHCEPLCIDGRYKHAALEAMTQVELALKEKSGIKNKFGVNLCSGLLGEGKSIQLRVPFGEEAQKAAERLFSGAFSYYRNYAAHDGSNIDKRICLRVMVLASELRDLIGASALSFADVGGVDGLITLGIVSAGEELRRLLHLLDGYTIPDEIVDGFFEALALSGFSERQLQAVIDIGLVKYCIEPYVPSEAEWSSVERFGDTFIPDSVGWFALTPLGKAVMQDVARNAT